MPIEKIRGTQPLDPNAIIEQSLQPINQSEVGKTAKKEVEKSKEQEKIDPKIEKLFSKLGNILNDNKILEDEEFKILKLSNFDELGETEGFFNKIFSLLKGVDNILKAFYPNINLPQSNLSNTSNYEVSMYGLIASQGKGAILQELIARAELLEELLDVVPVPEGDGEDPMLQLLKGLLGVLRKVGAELEHISKEQAKEKPKSEYTLRPSANNSDGFDKTIIVK